MKEIGGYLDFERYYGQEFHKNCILLNSARNCLRYLIKSKEIKELWISPLNCEAVFEACRRENVTIHYYHVDSTFKPILVKCLPVNSFVYVTNYYGQLEEEDVQSLLLKDYNIILDNVQSFFTEPIKGADVIYTCRKFFGVPDGAYLYTENKNLSKKLKIDTSYRRIIHLYGRFEVDAESFYSDFLKAEKEIDNLPIRRMSKYTNNLLKSFDYNVVKGKRSENFKMLQSKLSTYNQLKIRYVDGPYAYPFYTREGNLIRKELQKQKIYIPILWPNVLQSEEASKIEFEYAENILPLPCDQRYMPSDMEYIAQIIKSIIERDVS